MPKGLNPANAMYRYFDAWVPTEVRVRVRVRVGVRFRDPRFEIAVPRISGTRPKKNSPSKLTFVSQRLLLAY